MQLWEIQTQTQGLSHGMALIRVAFLLAKSNLGFKAAMEFLAACRDLFVEFRMALVESRRAPQ